jgi:hypothetical protein
MTSKSVAEKTGDFVLEKNNYLICENRGTNDERTNKRNQNHQ